MGHPEYSFLEAVLMKLDQPAEEILERKMVSCSSEILALFTRSPNDQWVLTAKKDQQHSAGNLRTGFDQHLEIAIG